MILYIRETIPIKLFDDSNKELLKRLSIKFKELELDNDFVEIECQKVTLDEFAMNELFYEIFNSLKIEYAYMGGKGCDFNINIFNSLEG